MKAILASEVVQYISIIRCHLAHTVKSMIRMLLGIVCWLEHRVLYLLAQVEMLRAGISFWPSVPDGW